METNTSKVFKVVLADDDPDDRMIFEKAFQEIDLKVELSLVKDGLQLMNLLNGPDVFLPDILFLDLNMPCKNGFECLEEIKTSAQLKDIFVVICSTSGSYSELDETFNNGANLFMKKVNSFSELKLALKKILLLDHRDYLLYPKKEKFLMKA